MKILYTTIAFVCLLLTLSTCKKYPDGGFVNQTRMHLFGGHNAGDSKTWKLKLYEVNGIDSTRLIQGAASIPDFYDKFVTFKLTDSKYISFEANTFLTRYRGSIDRASKQLNIALYNISWTYNDSTQCNIINGVNYCSRNVLIPEMSNRNSIWNIEELTKKKIVMTFSLKNSYKIILTT